MTEKKKLIEVSLPLEVINLSSAHEKQPGIGAHPRGLHLWWARRPLAAARAVIFAQMVDDPSSYPDLFPTERAQEKERKRLFGIIEELVQWENTNNDEVLKRARQEIWNSWKRTCAEHADHPQAKELFDRNKLPAFHDPFAGGGALPLEAQRLGFESYASDLNPVAVLINKAMIEIPPKFAGMPPVNPEARKERTLIQKEWKGAEGLADDVRYYGNWMQEEAKNCIGHLYPKVEITKEMVRERPDLKPLLGQELTVIAWIWARTVKSPNPAFAKVDVPLASTFFLSTKKGKESYVEPLIEKDRYRFIVKVGKPKNFEAIKNGTKVGRGGNFQCLLSSVPIPVEKIREQGVAGTMSSRLMAVVAEGASGRIYLSPDQVQVDIALSAKPDWMPETEINYNPRDIRTQLYGLTKYGDLFTPRQLVALNTFSDLVGEAIEKIKKDAAKAGLPNDDNSLEQGGKGARAYGEAVGVYLAFAIDRIADYNSSIATWKPSGEQVMQTYKRQAIPMTWDFPESNVLGSSAICWENAVKYSANNLLAIGHLGKVPGFATQANAMTQNLSNGKVVSTDPPYYDNIGYADLSDFFYVWLRRSLKNIFPSLFSTVSVPKSDELVATPYRHGSKDKAETFFLDGMTKVMNHLATQAHQSFPVTIYYAFKQSETETSEGISNTGWSTFLDAVVKAGFSISGTWPMRTELSNRMVGAGTNALASSIILVCNKRSIDAKQITKREFNNMLKSELPLALKYLQKANIAPVDLAQASIGPGMSIFTRYEKVIEASGSPLKVSDALALINQTLDEVLAEQEGDFDADTRWALAWFDQFGFAESEFGTAETLSKAKNTSLSGLEDAGILVSRRGKVRLLKPEEMEEDWDPEADNRLTVWEMVHQLVRLLETGGETKAAEIIAKLGTKAEPAKELSYRLYSICERKKRSTEAQWYNALAQSWSELTRISKGIRRPGSTQQELFDN